MSAARDPDALSVCVLQDAQRRDRSSTCTVAVGSRSFGARSALHPADSDRGYDVFHAADDTAGRHGSRAAENDELYDAGVYGLHQLYPAGRAEPVLGYGPADWDRATGGAQPKFAGPRNARDDREAGAEEREIAVSRQPSAVSAPMRWVT